MVNPIDDHATRWRGAFTHILFAIAVVAIGWLLIGFAPMPALPAKPPPTGTIIGPDGEFCATPKGVGR